MEDPVVRDNISYTISKKGITTYLGNDPVEYISLNDWIHE